MLWLTTDYSLPPRAPISDPAAVPTPNDTTRPTGRGRVPPFQGSLSYTPGARPPTEYTKRGRVAPLQPAACHFCA